jgi:hypothetical protein
MVRRRQRRRLPSGHHRPPPQLDDAVRLAVDDDGRLCLAPPIIVKPIDRQCDDRVRLIHTACLRPLPPRSSSTTTTTTSASARTPTPSSPNRDPPRRPSSSPSTSSTRPAPEAVPPSLRGRAARRRAVATTRRPIGDAVVFDICGRGRRRRRGAVARRRRVGPPASSVAHRFCRPKFIGGLTGWTGRDMDDHRPRWLRRRTASCLLALTTCSPQRIPPNQAQGTSPTSHR